MVKYTTFKEKPDNKNSVFSTCVIFPENLDGNL
jgi:hypothetical protein